MSNDDFWEMLQCKLERHESLQVKVIQQMGVGFVVDALGHDGFIRYYIRYYYPGQIVDVIPYEISAENNILDFTTTDYCEVQEAIKESELKDGALVEAKVVGVDKEQAFVKIESLSCELPIFASELAIHEPQFAYDVVHVGDQFLVYVVNQSLGYRKFYFSSGYVTTCFYISKRKADSIDVWRRMKNNVKQSKATAVKINRCNEKGLFVDADGLKGFIPAEEVDIKPVYDLPKFLNKELIAIPIEVDMHREVLILSRRAYLEHNDNPFAVLLLEEEKEIEEEKKIEDERKRRQQKEEEKKRYTRVARERNPFAINNFLSKEEPILSQLNIYDSDLQLYITRNWFFVVDCGLKEMLPLRQITRVSLCWYDANKIDDNVLVYGNNQDAVAIDVFNVSNNRWRFYVPEDLSSSVIDFIRTLLKQEGKNYPSSTSTNISSTSCARTERINGNDERWN